MTATDIQGVKRGAVACLQGDALQHYQAITCRCFDVGSDILGAHNFYTATSDLGDFSITRLQEVILASDDAHLWYQPCEDIHLNIHEDIYSYHQTPIQTNWGLFDWYVRIASYTPLTPGYAIRLARSHSTPYRPDQ
ncbi:hypothetical protein AnigIFM59636_011751 [Aspergillus niger]|uniref:Uncharacterized protein n=3 Tax=Aspergillus niger TaxID=5061 RepID=A2QVR0_ASPNC|nr:hypothetical protein An11g02330 [Aspergillus niger]RDH14829.1 hypothetical protein M747DRAFT_319201 [Aspergillus niger ATCC 13496]GKZ97001.1 hypothetical protein AnigIFM59636_011751 [Aspergillus niger]CAK40592.1 hypothetical protein An11g02330 [Aspergillus niger]